MTKRPSFHESRWSDTDDDDCIIVEPVQASSTSLKKRDTSVKKVFHTKKITQWVSSSFDGFGDFTTKPTRETKVKAKENDSGSRSTQKQSREATQSSFLNDFGRRNAVTRRANVALDNTLWSEKHAPKTQADLAVHKKKISEVEAWIKDHLNIRKQVPPVLLLTGPAGVGKTATVQILAKELGCKIQEWTNPITDGSSAGWTTDEDWRTRSRMDVYTSSSQAAQFQEFLLRANKYNVLDIFGSAVQSQKIIMVEDFPNSFYKDAATFQDIVRKYVRIGGSPLIFIVSDSTSGESVERLLFPKDFQSQLAIHNISFNPIAMTSMTKVLTKVATDESLKGSHKFTVPSKSVIESIAMSSAGDIRGALNALQFACLRDTHDLATSCSAKGKKAKAGKKTSSNIKKTTFRRQGGLMKASTTREKETDEELASIGGRDTSLFLFRALGKILYCKRGEPSSDDTTGVLPAHLSHHYRDPLLVDPEDVVERSHMSGDYFSAYLHQNYLDFYNSIEDVVSASEYVSDADYLTIDWASRSALQMYAASVATRGLMFSNMSRAYHGSSGAGQGWKPLHKPQWYTSNRTARQNCDTARHMFRMYRSAPVVLQTEIIPYISPINITLHDTGQINFVQEMCRFSNKRISRYEKLDEKDVDVDEDEDVPGSVQGDTLPGGASTKVTMETDDLPSSQSEVKVSQEGQADVEEEYEIEDYDD